MRTPIPVLSAILVASLFAGCDIRVGEDGVSVDVANGRASDEWRRTYTVAPGGRVEVTNGNGAIEVLAAAGSQVEILAERMVRSGSDEEAAATLRNLKMTEEVAPDRVRVELASLDSTGGRSWSRTNVSIRYIVRVPAGLKVSAANGNGGVRVDGVSGSIEASTTNGGITAERVTGSLKAIAVNGGIRAAMAALSGDVEVSVTNGGIRLELPPDVKASLNASCVNGGIRVADSLKLQATETSRRQVTGTFNGGGHKIVASTVNGGINISSVGEPDGDDDDDVGNDEGPVLRERRR